MQYTFTFQYGSTLILNAQGYKAVVCKFTFQYGSTLIL